MMIRQAGREDIPALNVFYQSLGKTPGDYFEECLSREQEIYIAQIKNDIAGYGILNFSPRYTVYKKLSYPEIQDLNVLPNQRRQGIASALITFFEQTAAARNAGGIGISVALNKDYGPAQRLYTKLGFMPDGYGVTYDRSYVHDMQTYPVDDDLCLMLVKEF